MGDRLKSVSGTARLLKSPSVRVIVGAGLIIEMSIFHETWQHRGWRWRKW